MLKGLQRADRTLVEGGIKLKPIQLSKYCGAELKEDVQACCKER